MAVKTMQAIINGQTVTLTKNSESGKWEATITAPNRSSYNQSGHYYPVTVKATDDAGNYCFVLKWLLMFDPSSLCAHLIPCPYQAEVVPPLFYAELLQPACGRR